MVCWRSGVCAGSVVNGEGTLSDLYMEARTAPHLYFSVGHTVSKREWCAGAVSGVQEASIH